MSIFRRCGIVFALLLFAGAALSGEAVVSTMKNVAAYFDFYGYSIRPVGTTTTPGDDGPTQLFEIVRPSFAGFTIGRIYTSCTCIRVTSDKRSFAAGEIATLTVRNVLPTSGNTYPFYVQLTSPVRATLRYDTYVISDRYTGAASVVVENVETAADEVEIIVPEHDLPAEEPPPEPGENG